MRKLLFMLSLVPALLASCTSDNVTAPDGATGTIILGPSINMTVDDTRAENLATYFVKLTGQQTMTIPYPADNTISGLEPGSYTVEVTNYTDGMPAPNFDKPYYSGSSSVTLEAGQQEEVDITCRQLNSGLFFTFDPSLDTDYPDLTPTVTQQAAALVYKDGNKFKTGYFAPGSAVITLKNGSDDVNLGGEASKTIALQAEKLYKIVLTADEVSTGGINLEVTVIEIDTPNEFESWVVSGGGEEPGGMQAIGYGGQSITVTFVDGTTATATLGADGKFDLEGDRDRLIRSIQKAGDDPILIGRTVESGFTIKVENGSVVFRDAVNGNIPIGTMAEFILIGKDAAAMTGDYIQEADLNFMAIDWEPIGKWEISGDRIPFSGTFDGNNKTIEALKVFLDINYCGLFGYSTGELKNINLGLSSVTGKSYVGGICGWNSGGEITNCNSRANVMANADYAGGIVGQSSGLIMSCVNTGEIFGMGNYTGGICGGGPGTIENCHNKQEIIGYGGQVGGVCGWLGDFTDYNGIIRNCTNIAKVSGSQAVGGICGKTLAAGNIDACQNSGEVTGATDNMGGICGDNSGLINNCTNEGYVTSRATGPQAGANVGGIVGIHYGHMEECENLGEVFGRYNATGGVVGRQYYPDASTSDCVNRGKVSALGNPYTYNVGGIGGVVDGTLERCVNHGEIFGNVGDFGFSTAGIAGGTDADIYDCINYGTITGSFDCAAGIVGHHYSGTISGARNYGIINGASNHSAGIVGEMTGGQLIACMNEGEVKGKGEQTGGIVGGTTYMASGGTSKITACYNTADVSSTGNGVGGILGYHVSGQMEMSACYNTGKVTNSANYTGGIIGVLNGGSVANCYWSKAVGSPNNAIGSPAGNGTCLIFGDGTTGTGWPTTAMPDWGVVAPGAKGSDGNYWKEYGTWASAAGNLPRLWWEE